MKISNKSNIQLNLSGSDIYNKSKDAAVTIFGNYKRSSWSGSGFFAVLNNEFGYVITNAHVVIGGSYRNQKADYLYVNITNFNGTGVNKFIKTTEYYVDVFNDIGIVKVPGITNKHRHLQIRDYEKLKNGDTVYVIGNPLEYDYSSISKGVVRDKQYTFFDGSLKFDSLFVDNPGFAGNSGSPILNSRGNVVGIYGWGIDGTESLGGGLKGDVLGKIAEIIVANKADYITKRYLGFDWELIGKSYLDNYGLTDFSSDGLIIKNINRDSPFFNKLLINDILYSFIIDNKSYHFGYQSEQFSPDAVTTTINTTKNIVVQYGRFDKDNNFKIKVEEIVLDQDYANRIDQDVFGGSIQAKNNGKKYLFKLK